MPFNPSKKDSRDKIIKDAEKVIDDFHINAYNMIMRHGIISELHGKKILELQEEIKGLKAQLAENGGE